MPDSSGRFRGSGWSRAREDGWERAFELRVRDLERQMYDDPFDLRDRDPLYVDDIAPLIYAARLRTGRPRIKVRVTPEQHTDLLERLKRQVPLGTGDPFGGAVKFLVE